MGCTASTAAPPARVGLVHCQKRGSQDSRASTDSSSVKLGVTDARDKRDGRVSTTTTTVRRTATSARTLQGSSPGSDGSTVPSDWGHMRSASISESVTPQWDPQLSPTAGRASAPPRGQSATRATSERVPRTPTRKRGNHKWISRTMWDVRHGARTASNRTTPSVTPLSGSPVAELEAPVRFCPTAEDAHVGGPGNGWVRACGEDVGLDVDTCFLALGDVDVHGYELEGEDSLLEDEDMSPVKQGYGLADIGAAEARSLFGPGSQSFVDVVAFSAAVRESPRATE